MTSVDLRKAKVKEVHVKREDTYFQQKKSEVTNHFYFQEIQHSSTGAGPFSEEAELRFHCYRILQFKFKDSTPPPPPPKEPSDDHGNNLAKKKKKRKSVKEKSLKSAEPPPVAKPLTNIFYRFEIECPILSEPLHELVNFLAEAVDEEALVPEELLNR